MSDGRVRSRRAGRYAFASDGTPIRFDTFGARGGEPVLMIQGLGADRRAWWLQHRAIGRRYRGISFDNRGSGQSGTPEGPYDIEVMAADALAVLDAAGYGSAHVMGASMGGVMAQILALRHPARVRSLVLVGTGCRHRAWRNELLASWAATAGEGGVRRVAGGTVQWLFAPRFQRRAAVLAAVLGPFVLGAPGGGFASQVAAILGADESLRARLPGVRVPTLVVVGELDVLTPPADARELAGLIPGAELVVVPGAGHAVMLERPAAYNRAVLDFLDRVTGDSPGSARAPLSPGAAASGPSR